MKRDNKYLHSIYTDYSSEILDVLRGGAKKSKELLQLAMEREMHILMHSTFKFTVSPTTDLLLKLETPLARFELKLAKLN